MGSRNVFDTLPFTCLVIPAFGPKSPQLGAVDLVGSAVTRPSPNAGLNHVHSYALLQAPEMSVFSA